ncbi:ase aspergillopepsin II [Cordyceps militaris]|uniref:Ase aspergillopepsin II n=1 Tax=Cordyceps militaris TaxID=73501 RepID=A0A2H4S941_CORMI|nr:ase aspergillopepsin II [Cordyceps militaris]
MKPNHGLLDRFGQVTQRKRYAILVAKTVAQSPYNNLYSTPRLSQQPLHPPYIHRHIIIIIMKTAAVVALLSATGGAVAATVGPQTYRNVPVGGPLHKKVGSFAGQQVNSPWGGGVQEGRGWTFVTGTTKIPSITGQNSYAGTAAWVGIDGYSCQSAILQTGVQAHGDGTVRAWYEWYPEAPVYYDDQFPVQSGDVIRMSVNATSATSGTSTLENLTSGRSVTTPYDNMSESLCGSDAEWILEFGGDSQTFADFGEWDFYDTQATSAQGTVSADGSTITNVKIDGQTLTNCRADSQGVECAYSG